MIRAVHMISSILVTLIVVGITVYVFSDYIPEQYVPPIMLSMNKSKKVTVNQGIKGQIEFIEGKVEKRISPADGWRDAETAEIVRSGMEIRTLAKAKAIITFEDGSAARLDENSQVRLESSENKIELSFSEGSIYNKVTKNDQREYTVNVDNYRVTALGTIFSVEKKAEGLPQVLVMESQVAVKDDKGSVIGNISDGKVGNINAKEVKERLIPPQQLKESFMVWNMEQDKKIALKEAQISSQDQEKSENKPSKKKEAKKVDASGQGNIVLTGKKSDKGVTLSWQVSGVDSSHGFKILKSEKVNPGYPGNDAQFIADPNVRSFSWDIDTGEKYHFRLCTYNGSGGCGMYSNDVYMDTSEADDSDEKKVTKKHNDDEEYASGVSLSAKNEDGKAKLSWSISGGDAPKGFKIVMDTEKNPVYPGDTYQYLSDPSIRSYTWAGDFKIGTTYHFRVCVYKGGSCGTYSDNIAITF